jgi:hypothetical protein
MRRPGTVHPLIAFARPSRALITNPNGAVARHSGTSQLRSLATTSGLLCCLVLAEAVTAKAQFKEARGCIPNAQEFRLEVTRF